MHENCFSEEEREGEKLEQIKTQGKRAEPELSQRSWLLVIRAVMWLWSLFCHHQNYISVIFTHNHLRMVQGHTQTHTLLTSVYTNTDYFQAGFDGSIFFSNDDVFTVWTMKRKFQMIQMQSSWLNHEHWTMNLCKIIIFYSRSQWPCVKIFSPVKVLPISPFGSLSLYLYLSMYCIAHVIVVIQIEALKRWKEKREKK